MERYMSITANIGVKELYEFTLKHNYRTFHGIIGVLFSIASAIGGFLYWDKLTMTNRVLIVIFALTFTVFEPVGCYIKVRKQVKKNFSTPLIYMFDAKGITITQGGQNAQCFWYEVMKVTSTKNLINIYTTPVRAFILPKKDIGENFNKLKELIDYNAQCRRVDIK